MFNALNTTVLDSPGGNARIRSTERRPAGLRVVRRRDRSQFSFRFMF